MSKVDKILVLTVLIFSLLFAVAPSSAFAATDAGGNNNFFASIFDALFHGKTPSEKQNSDSANNNIAVASSTKSTKPVLAANTGPIGLTLDQRVGQLESQFSQVSFNNAPGITIVDTAGGNLLRNSSFEAGGAGSFPSQWNQQLDSNSGNTFISAEGIHSGNYGLKFSGGGTGNFGISQPNTKTTPQRTYTLSGYVKIINAPSVTFRLGFWDEYNNREGTFKNFTLSGTQDWKRFYMTVTTPGLITDSKNWYPMIQAQGLKSGNVYLDDVQLTEGSILTTYNTALANGFSNSLTLGDGSILTSTAGDLYPAQSGVGNLGTSSNKWNSLNLNKASVDGNGNLNLSGGATVSGAAYVGSLSINNNLILSSTQSAIPVGIGGTGQTSFTANGVLYGNGTSGLSILAPSTSGYILQTNGTGSAPSWVAATSVGAAFSSLAGGTNTGAAMIVGSGASLTLSGTGTINANQLNGQTTSVGGALTTGGAFTTSGANALTLTTTGATNLTLPTSGTVTALGNTTTGTGSLVLATSPTLTTPNIGAATATTVNGLTLTANATGFSVAGGTTSKTLTTSNTLTLAGTDATTITFQGTDTYVGRATTDTLTNKTLTAPAINGTVTTTGLTLPAFTASGNITGSGSPTISSFGAINGLTLSATSVTPAAAGVLSVTSNGANALTLDTGGAAAVNIGNTNANALAFGNGTTNPTYTFNGSGTFSTSTGTNTLNGNTTIVANKTLTLSSGTGTITQNYSNTTGAATTFNVTNSNAGAGTSVNGLSIALVGTAPSSGTNTNTGINFGNVTAVANNTFNAITFGTGYTNFLTSSNININASGVITGAGSYNGVSLSSTTVQPVSAGAFTFQSNGANTVTLDAGGAAGVNIGTTNANAITLGANTTISANKSLTLSSGTGQISQTYSNTVAGNASVYNVTNGNTGVTATAVSGLDLTLTNATNTNSSNTLNGVTFEAATNNNSNVINGLNFASATGYTNFLKTPSITITSAGNITGAGTIASGAITDTSSGANALAVGQTGTTNPALNVDASTASSVTGLNVKSAALAGGLALSVISSGANENLTLDAKGTGTVTINGTATGGITLSRATTISGLATLNNGLTLGAGSNLTSDSGTATAVAGAATLNKQSGTITSEALTTAAGSTYTLTLTDSVVTAGSRVFASADNGTNTGGELTVQRITPAAGSVVILVKNTGASVYNGTIKINFLAVL